MTCTSLQDSPAKEVAAQAEGPAGGAVSLTMPHALPARLLDGGEVVQFAIKPSPWFVIFVSLKWIVAGAALIALANTRVVPTSWRDYVLQLAFVLAGARLAWAMLEWVSRLYVLTNRRVMRIRGMFTVDLFECSLDKIQNTSLTLTPLERLLRVGTITVQTAVGPASVGGGASWRIVAKPLEIHEKLRAAIHRARNRGSNGL